MKNLLLTGATGRFGQVVTRQLLQKGYSVFFTSRSRGSIKKFEEQNSDFIKDGALLKGYAVDLTDSSSREGFLSELSEPIHCLVHAARNPKNLDEGLELRSMASESKWIDEYKMAAVVPCDLILSLFEKFSDEFRNAVLISSMYGSRAVPRGLYKDKDTVQCPVHYGTAKAALNQLCRELAARLGPDGVRVNGLSYGGIEGRESPEFRKNYNSLVPIGRMLASEDLFKPLELLIESEGQGITGQVIEVDGGFSIW